MIPCRGNTFLFRSYQLLPHLYLGPFKGFLSRHDALQGPQLTSCVASGTTEKQGRRLACWAKHGLCRKLTTQTLILCV